MFNTFSPIKDETYIKDNDNNDLEKGFQKLSMKEDQEIRDSSVEKKEKFIQSINGYSQTVKLGMWNPHGKTFKGYAELRRLLCSQLVKDYAFDILMLQEPKKTQSKLMPSFNISTLETFTYEAKPHHREEVCILYNSSKLQCQRIDIGEEILALKNENENFFESQFVTYSQKRTQAAVFTIVEDPAISFLLLNVHSIYNGSTNRAKKNYIIDLFKFANHLHKKHQGISVLICGDFNYDIYASDIVEECFEQYNFTLNIVKTPDLDSYDTNNKKNINNIDFFSSISDDPFCLTNVQRIPLLYIEKEDISTNQALKFAQDHQLELTLSSSHDPIYGLLKFTPSQNLFNQFIINKSKN
ncbi:hypothetical protein CYY_005059 [Polysphondylium violaceum]|uniref:Endonuclease/exonuclease/phosphatase domain-containing protein n=1 Tax=Polysphondylium violaceum TaxID=133409 RepID=A0A8J4PUX1_9MYCE|nr:hypothetical protein CYY_005059 [Polysphondylium violaceum]